MKRGKQVRSKQRERKKSRANTKPGLAAHKAFAPLLGLWGALLGAMVVLVLPSAGIQRALSGTLMGTWGEGGWASWTGWSGWGTSACWRAVWSGWGCSSFC